jgi:hypothetical protein
MNMKSRLALRKIAMGGVASIRSEWKGVSETTFHRRTNQTGKARRKQTVRPT